MKSSLEDELDRLFQVPLGEFIAARNALAASVKKRGDAEASKRVKQIAKPTPSAWAVNQLYWSSKPLYDALIAAGDGYRRAQRAALSGEAGTLEEEDRRRRKAIDEAERRAVWLLRQQRQEASPTILRRIRTALEALASYGSDNPSPFDGRYVADLEAPGFAALASLGPIARKAEAPAAPEAAETESTKRLEAAERELTEARASLDAAAKAVERATAELQSARERSARAESAAQLAAAELERARKRVADLEKARK